MNPVEFGTYAQMLCEPQFADWKAPQFAEALGVTTTTIYRWDKKVNWEWILSERRKKFSRFTSEVDNSLLKAARKLDVQAIRTWYERFDSWVPTSKTKTEHSISDAEVEAELNALIERKRAAVAALDASGRSEAAGPNVGTPATEAGRTAEILPAESGPTEVHK